jgi:DHA1 family tetracycline resistance protein-like MFS transporter
MFQTSSSSATTAATPDDHDDNNKKERQAQRRRRISVFAILISAFLNLLGFTMAGPITPALGKHFDLPIGASFGSLTSAYPFGMLFGLFVWPTLSDSLGRKPIIASSLLGSGIGLVAQAVVIQREASLTWFLVCRAFTGAFAGSSPVSKAYLADIGYRDGKLPRYLALRDAASTMAFIVGPMLGGILYDIRRRIIQGSAEMTQIEVLSASGSLAFVIGISAAATLVAALLVGLLVQDVKPKKQRSKDEGATNDSADDGSESTSSSSEVVEEDLVACPLGSQMWAGVASVCVVSFLFNVGDSTFHAFFSALLKDAAGKATADIGLLYTLLACVSFVVSTTGSSWLMKRHGPVVTCAVGLGFVGTGLSALGIAAASQVATIPPRFAVLAAAAAVYYCGVPLYGPTIPTMLLRCVPSHRRGAIMGLDGTINTIARIISPLLMGDVYRRYGPGAAFGLAGMAVFGGAVTALLRRFVVLKNLHADDSSVKKKG